MERHIIKLNIQFCDAVNDGVKSFEIVNNDRDYQVGDYIQFLPVDDEDRIVKHTIVGKRYKITYIIEDWGLQDGYVAFSIEELPQYCRYCAFCRVASFWKRDIEGHWYYCTALEKSLNENSIKRQNKCKKFEITEDVVTGKEYKPHGNMDKE